MVHVFFIYYCLDILIINYYLVYKYRYERNNHGKTSPSQREYGIEIEKAITLQRSQMKYNDIIFMSPQTNVKKVNLFVGGFELRIIKYLIQLILVIL